MGLVSSSQLLFPRSLSLLLGSLHSTWFPESFMTRATRLWFFQVHLQELSQEILPTTALPLHTSHFLEGPEDCWGFSLGSGWSQQS